MSVHHFHLVHQFHQVTRLSISGPPVYRPTGSSIHRFTVSGFFSFQLSVPQSISFHQFSSILSQFFISSPVHQFISSSDFGFSSFSGPKFSVFSHFSFPVSVFQVFSFHHFIGFPAFSLSTGQFSVLHSHVSGLSFTVFSSQSVSSSIVSFHFSTSPQSVNFFLFQFIVVSVTNFINVSFIVLSVVSSSVYF